MSASVSLFAAVLGSSGVAGATSASPSASRESAPIIAAVPADVVADIEVAASDEPEASCADDLGAVWVSLVAPVDGRLSLDTVGSNADTTLAVFRAGTDEQLACNDDELLATTSRLAFNAESGKRYDIRLGARQLEAHVRLHIRSPANNSTAVLWEPSQMRVGLLSGTAGIDGRLRCTVPTQFRLRVRAVQDLGPGASGSVESVIACLGDTPFSLTVAEPDGRFLPGPVRLRLEDLACRFSCIGLTVDDVDGWLVKPMR